MHACITGLQCSMDELGVDELRCQNWAWSRGPVTGDVSDTSVTTDATFAQTTFGAQRARELGALLPVAAAAVAAAASECWCC